MLQCISPFLIGLMVIFATITMQKVTFSAETAPLKVGSRPYEMDWAGRMTDEVPPFIDFESMETWLVETTEAEATFECSEEQKIWGDFTAKLTYRATTDKPQKTPTVVFRPASPIPLEENPNIPDNFEAFSCWVFGNNWSWSPDPGTPPTSLSAVFLVGKEQRRIEIRLKTINWREWFLIFVHLDAQQRKDLHTPGTCFDGFVLRDGRNTEPRTLFFDNVALRSDALDTGFSFTERARRGVVRPEQNQGVNTLKDAILPFPTRPETILPECKETVKNTTKQDTETGAILFTGVTQTGTHPGTLTFRYAPTVADKAPWDSLTAEWNGKVADNTPGNGKIAKAFHPLQNGGITELALPDGSVVPVVRHELLDVTLLDDAACQTRWNVVAEKVSVEATYTLKMLGKTLLIETHCLGGDNTARVANVIYGSLSATDVTTPHLFPIPYDTYAYGGTNRPAYVVFRDKNDQTLFLSGHTDWFLGNGSVIYSSFRTDEDRIFYNDGVRYNARTDGKRNPCFERFFVSVSPDFQEVLPTIPNPKSPWISVMGSGQWHARGASNREKDAEFWANVYRHGMRDLIVLDHEVGWRDGGESFTFRTRTAPGKGGDEGQRWFSDFMNRELKIYYGPYNNFTDFAPVNEFWSTDMVTRTPDKQLLRAWPRCYAPKPVRAVEYCEKLTPINQEKYQFRCGYCDVHTAVTPCERVDYDARVPGAGTWAGTFYAFGEIMLLQKKDWGGPVYSEGPMHHFYAGLNDGSYAQDQGYRIPFRPWIVDYDLLKLHPISCNFGMGNVDMFYSHRKVFQDVTPEEKDALLDRFFAATLAFGHPGYLPIQHGIRTAWRGYFNLIELQKHYTVCQPEWIRYGDASGKLVDTSEAIAGGAYLRSQVAVKYTDGTVICANGSETETFEADVDGVKISLPPTGYCAWTDCERTKTFSGLKNGTRCDYAYAPTHIYLDGRGTHRDFPLATGSGAGVCRKVNDNYWEIITLDGAEMGFRIPDFSKWDSSSSDIAFLGVHPEAVALAKDGSEMGKTEVTRSRGYVYVKPVEGAFSYRVETCDAGCQEAVKEVLHCDASRVLAGETVQIQGGEKTYHFTIPETATAGEHVWFTCEEGRLDFIVVNLCNVQIVSENADAVTFKVENNFNPKSADSKIVVRHSGKDYPVDDNDLCTIPFANTLTDYPQFYRLKIVSDEKMQEKIQDVVLKSRVTMEYLPYDFDPSNATKKWVQLRGKSPTVLRHNTGAVAEYNADNVCGGERKTGYFTHPPYLTGPGCTFLEFPLDLPADKTLALSAFVGKRNGSDSGDGILYQVAVLDSEQNTETHFDSAKIIAECTVNDHAWTPIFADLSAYAGRKIRLFLITDCGRASNTSGDWGTWADIRLHSAEKKPVRNSNIFTTWKFRKVEEFGEDGMTLEKLRTAKRGWVCYSGKGLAGGGDRPTYGFLNGVPAGQLLGASGDERNGIFSQEVRVPLSTEALATVALSNTYEIQNEKEDCFSIRDFRILLEFEDGSQISSRLTPVTFTQPTHWAYAEGVLVESSDKIGVPIWF